MLGVSHIDVTTHAAVGVTRLGWVLREGVLGVEDRRDVDGDGHGRGVGVGAGRIE